MLNLGYCAGTGYLGIIIQNFTKYKILLRREIFW